MVHAVLLGAGLAIVSGTMNGLFTFPMRFLSRWEWENVWSIFIVSSCLVLPCVLIGVTAPRSWAILWHAPVGALGVALLTGFLWGFGAIMFGQSVSALGISLANTLVLAISSALGSFVPLVVLSPARLRTHAGRLILLGVAIEIAGIVLCGFAGRVRESGGSAGVARGRLVGRARPPAIGLLLTLGAGVLSAVFNIGFALAQPIADAGMRAGLGVFASTNLIWLVMLGAGSVANLGFCGVLALRNRSFAKFAQPGKRTVVCAGHGDGPPLGREHLCVWRGGSPAWCAGQVDRLAPESGDGAGGGKRDRPGDW